MSFRRRHRWTRRFVVGLAFAAFVAPAQARPAPDATIESGSAAHVLPDFSGAHGDPYLTDLPSRPGEAGAGPDGIVLQDSGSGIAGTAVRPDDRAERFVVTGGSPAASPIDDGVAIDWQNGLTFGIGALGLALALGVAVAYLRRPRLAGL